VGARQVIEDLGLERHPEGGWYRRTWTHPERDGMGRARASAIDYLLESGDRSAWHRIDADEVWIWRAGEPLVLRTMADGTPGVAVLGPQVGQTMLHVVPAGVWQSARLAPPPDGDQVAADGASAPGGDGYGLVACMVVPEFTFDGFELAPDTSHWG
jgi:uncharacterized protein